MVIALFCLKIVSEAGYTMMNIAMGSLLGAMSTNDTERATLSSARGMGSTLGNAVTGVIVPQLIARFGDNAQGYGYTALVVVPLGVIIVFTHYMLTVERNTSAQQQTQQDNKQSKLNIKDIWGIFAKTVRSLLWLSTLSPSTAFRLLVPVWQVICTRTFWAMSVCRAAHPCSAPVSRWES